MRSYSFGQLGSICQQGPVRGERPQPFISFMVLYEAVSASGAVWLAVLCEGLLGAHSHIPAARSTQSGTSGHTTVVRQVWQKLIW